MISLKKKTRILFRRAIKFVAPPPKLTISEWADQRRKLSSENAAEPGQWRTDRAPYQREIMDSVTDPRIEKVIVESSSQVGKSEIINNVIGYYIDVDPGPLLMIQPTIEIAQDYSKRRISPMINDTETLAQKVADSKTRDINNTILMKVFPGGFLAMGGANSPAGLASRPIKILLCDEVDRYPASAGTEGDPISLAEKRTTTFWNRKKVFVSTPTIKGASRIEAEYELGTQEKWCIKCPGCGKYHQIVMADIKFDYEKHEKNRKIIYTVGGVWWKCPSCGQLYEEYIVKKQPAKWIASNPMAIENGVRSFWMNSFVSPWYPWKRIIQEFLETKKNPEKFKVFVNTVLGETWEEEGEGIESEVLMKRREEYICEVPAGALVLTCGVDVQDNRLEYEVIGWGPGNESWGIKYGVIMGDPGQNHVWDMLDAVLTSSFIRRDGLAMKIMTTCVDSGGHHTEEVYKFCKKREFSRVWAIKGQGGSGVPFIQRPKKRNDAGVWLFNLGVDTGKDTLASRLKAEPGDAGYCHFPLEADRGYDQAFFEGLTAEHRVIRYSKGQARISWEKRTTGARNEPFDIRNYATAALEILNPPMEMLKKQLELQGSSPKTPLNGVKSVTKRAGLVSKGVAL